MIKLNRKTEYGLLAIRYLAGRERNTVASVRDIADHYGIPGMLLAKVMQQLKKKSIVSSVKGVSGGYSLDTDLTQLSFLEFLRVFEDDTALVDCLTLDDGTCQQYNCCDIREPLTVLNTLIQQQLKLISISDLFSTTSQVRSPLENKPFRIMK